MEALVAIFAEIIIACMMPVFALMGAVLSAVFEGLLLLFGGIFSEYVESRRKRRAEAVQQPITPRKPLIPRKVIHWTAGIFATIGALGVVASFVFFQPLLRYAMDVASDKAGMRIVYDSATGSLLGGNVTLQNLTMSRAHDTGLAFDLQVTRAEADVALTTLVFGTPTLTFGRVEGMTGTITPPLPKEEKKGLPKPRRPFRADLFALQDVSLQITPREDAPYSVVIDAAQVAPFRSGLAVFDLLFRSNMKAEIAGQSLLVETRLITDDGRETRWAFEDVDAALLKRILPKAPLTWVSEGRLTLNVSDRWSLSNDFVDMDWRIATSQMRTTVPQDAGAGERIVAAGLRKYVDRFGGDVDFQYQLQLDPEDMAQLREGDLEAFWEKLLSGIVKGGITKPDAQEDAEEAMEEEAPGAFDRIRSIFGNDEGKE